MGLSVADLQADRRTVAIPITLGDGSGGVREELLNVTYTPSAQTAEQEKETNRMFRESDWKSEVGLTIIKSMVVEWDLKGADGAAYPLDLDSLAKLPSHFITMVMVGIFGDMGKDLPSLSGS